MGHPGRPDFSVITTGSVVVGSVNGKKVYAVNMETNQIDYAIAPTGSFMESEVTLRCMHMVLEEVRHIRYHGRGSHRD